MDTFQCHGHFIFSQKYQLGHVPHCHIAHLPQSLLICITVLMLHGDDDVL